MYDVLQDLKKQTCLPKKVIIVEQNPIENSKSELNYIHEESWPFKIIHHFIHKTGACNARNLALSHVTSEWVFFADDDIRFDDMLIEKCFENLMFYGIEVININCLREKDIQKSFKAHQTSIFNSAASILKSNILDKAKFDMSYEFNYREDADFGMQIRYLGYDVISFDTPKIKHLKAPLGGFRYKIKQKWDDDDIKPKPSPTVMYFHQKYSALEQLQCYKLWLFITFYKDQNIRNVFTYLKIMKKRWNSSVIWSEKITSEVDSASKSNTKF